MQKIITKSINVTIKLSYSETCNLLKGGIVHTDIHVADLIPSGCLNDIKDNTINNLQLTIRMDEQAVKNLEFMKIYLQQKEKNESR